MSSCQCLTDKTELCWTLQTAHVIREADLSDWKTGDFKQLKLYAENEIGRPECPGNASRHKA
jgi:hypothetical protein